MKSVKSKCPTIPNQAKQPSTKHKLRQELKTWRKRKRGGWEISGDNFKVKDFNARTESCFAKESTPTKDTSNAVARPQSQFMQ